MWPFDWFWGAADTLNAILRLPWALGAMMLDVIQVILYPVFCAIDLAINLVEAVWHNVVSVPNAMIGMLNTILVQVSRLFVGNLPPWWITLVFLLITIRVYQLIYRKLRGIEIMGFKLP